MFSKTKLEAQEGNPVFKKKSFAKIMQSKKKLDVCDELEIQTLRIYILPTIPFWIDSKKTRFFSYLTVYKTLFKRWTLWTMNVNDELYVQDFLE